MGIVVAIRGTGRETKDHGGQEKKTHGTALPLPEKPGNGQYRVPMAFRGMG
jgi:hypothetical protein